MKLGTILDKRLYGTFELVKPACDRGTHAYEQFVQSEIIVEQIPGEDKVMCVRWEVPPTDSDFEKSDIVKLNGMVIESEYRNTKFDDLDYRYDVVINTGQKVRIIARDRDEYRDRIMYFVKVLDGRFKKSLKMIKSESIQRIAGCRE